MSEMIQVLAVNLSHTPNAMQDTLDGGGFATYAATEVRIIHPEGLANRELTIYHDEEVPEISPWRAVGHQILFTVDKDHVVAGEVLFEGAISNVQDASHEPATETHD